MCGRMIVCSASSYMIAHIVETLVREGMNIDLVEHPPRGGGI
jgi:hypothetical protein